MTKDAFNALKILVAEDETFSQKIVVMVLNNLGAKNIALAQNGAEALEILATATTGQPFNLVISDIEMPDMDGFELARRIRSGIVPKYKDIPILTLTGHSTEENVHKGRAHGIQGFIVKPPSADILERHMKRVLKMK